MNKAGEWVIGSFPTDGRPRPIDWDICPGRQDERPLKPHPDKRDTGSKPGRRTVPIGYQWVVQLFKSIVCVVLTPQSNISQFLVLELGLEVEASQSGQKMHTLSYLFCRLGSAHPLWLSS